MVLKKFKHFRQFAFVVFFVVFLSCCIDYDKLGESDPNISDAIDWSGLTRYCVFHVGLWNASLHLVEARTNFLCKHTVLKEDTFLCDVFVPCVLLMLVN